MHTPCIDDLLKACGILFGPGVDVSTDFLRYLRPAGLRAAYRQKALETHPDRARVLGMDEGKMAELFKATTLAYERLRSVITAEGIYFPMIMGKNLRAEKEGRTYSQNHRPRHSNHYYSGQLPRRHLLLGQFLYYSRVISWRDLIRAVAWQRSRRPRIGRVAMEWRMLSSHEIQGILKARRLGEKFGESAIRNGYLTRFQLMALLGKQHRLQPLIGEYFLRNGILLPRTLERELENQRTHNRFVATKK